ncbi:hypothetical protein ElyMa_003292800 [Elysia marginata]|uniref:Uncharacterized protein n=1 Tax=Elysia marginata TaxID=1093978 RepID=A0AAV4JG21_9GAST|nr:hypothetical protein ElyMa_003292800 [Elysia marginata]
MAPTLNYSGYQVIAACIIGNERADILAKKGSTAQQQNTTIPFRAAQQTIRNNSTEEWLNGWATGKTGRSLFTYMATPNPKSQRQH